jgi:Domain of unknown function (DUF6484)
MHSDDPVQWSAPADGAPIAVAGIQGIVVGVLIGLVEGGVALVSFPGNPTTQAVRARTLVQLHAKDVGRRVALLFELGDPNQPIVMGCVTGLYADAPAPRLADASIDGQKITICASSQLVLRCGNASITLSSDGGIEIRGVNLVSRASGRNRIFGGAIDLN